MIDEPTEAQVEAAAKELAVYEWVSWEVVPDHIKARYRAQARAALVAAQGAAPQEATAHSPVHFECDCVPNLGPPHCHACSDEVGNPVMWSACPNAAPVLPSGGVDEGKLAEVIADAVQRTVSDYVVSEAIPVARAVIASRAEWLKEQE